MTDIITGDYDTDLFIEQASVVIAYPFLAEVFLHRKEYEEKNSCRIRTVTEKGRFGNAKISTLIAFECKEDYLLAVFDLGAGKVIKGDV